MNAQVVYRSSFRVGRNSDNLWEGIGGTRSVGFPMNVCCFDDDSSGDSTGPFAGDPFAPEHLGDPFALETTDRLSSCETGRSVGLRPTLGSGRTRNQRPPRISQPNIGGLIGRCSGPIAGRPSLLDVMTGKLKL